MNSNEFDYIIIGGGLAGCTLAARLREYNPVLKVLLIEAGSDVSKHPLVSAPLACFASHGSDLDYNYHTTPQEHLDGRSLYQAAGKALSGGTAINYGTWTRGSAVDYDRWAQLVGDARWSYAGLLPYFRKTETYFRKEVNMKEHGTSGPIHTASVTSSSKNRVYPLREPLLKAWNEIGVKKIEDANNGRPLGVAELVENWQDGQRQLASQAYNLSGVQILTESTVKKVLFAEHREGPIAIGVELLDGSSLKATKEVIISAGAYRTPQILMLSGIGPARQLHHYNIPVIVENSQVGENFHDHLLLAIPFKLKNPQHGLSMGTPLWSDPSYQMGLPCDWIVTDRVSDEDIKKALAKEAFPPEVTHHMLQPDSCHTETLIVYAPAGAPITNHHVPMDGTHIGAIVTALATESRGKLTLKSSDPRESPEIDPNYYATELDRIALRTGIRKVLNLFYGTDDGKEMVEGENPPPGLPPLKLNASDEEIDVRVRSQGRTFFHAAGTSSMGTVVDTDLKVKGVQKLRVVDASVLPIPISAHYQVCVYAIAELAADIIQRDS